MSVQEISGPTRPSRARLIGRICAVAVGFGVLAYLSISFTRDLGRIPAIWPGNALVACALLKTPKRVWAYFIAAGLLAAFVVNLLIGDALPVAIGLASINAAESVLFAFACRRATGKELHLRLPGHLAAFGATSAFAPLLSGFAAASLLSSVAGFGFEDVFGRWLMAHCLGLLTVAPALLAVFSQSFRTTVDELRRKRSLPPLLSLALCLYLAFGPGAHPLPFLLFPALILCALRLSEAGVGLCLVVSTAVAIVASKLGSGPITIIQGGPPSLMLLLQLYLVTATLMSLSLSAAFSERKRFQAEAERTAAAKAAFMANISHELRTPLTAVVGYAALLARRDDLPADARTQIGRIADAGDGLLSIINDVLDFSKIEAGRMIIRPEPTAVEQIVRSVLAVFAHRAEGKGITLTQSGSEALPERLVIDPNRLRQILVNLVGNAVKFTDSGQVEVRCSYLADEQHLLIAVRDTGCGMDESQQAALFKRYSQVGQSASRIEGGTGLGLAISQDLVEAMGGLISVTSTPGEGSEFAFTIAAPPCDGEDGEVAEAEGGLNLSGVSILVVDDNPVNRDIAKAILSPLGVAVTEAADGLEAVTKGQETTFDLILMDLRMPNMNGPEAARRLRAEPGPNCAAPILAFSADIDAELVAGSHGAFNGYVRKPLQIQDLIEAVSAAVEAGNPLAPLQGGVSRRIGESI